MYVSRNLVDTFTGDCVISSAVSSVEHSTDVCCRLLCKHRLVTALLPPRRPPTHLRPRLSSAFPLQLESSDSATQLARSIPTDTALQLLGRTIAPTIAVMIVTRTVTMLI